MDDRLFADGNISFLRVKNARFAGVGVIRCIKISVINRYS